MMTGKDREILYDMITHNAAKVMQIDNYSPAKGNSGNLVVLNAEDLREAFCYHSAPRYIVRNGDVLEIA